MNKQEYNNQYNRSAYTGISIRLSNRSEKDLIDWLKSRDDMKGYITSLVRKDMKKQLRYERRRLNDLYGIQKEKTYEVIEGLPYFDHYSILYTDSIIEALTALAHYSSEKEAQHGPLAIIKRGYDADLNCYYGVQTTGL